MNIKVKTMQRREFIRLVSCGLAAGWFLKPWPARAFSATGALTAASDPIIACLADPHLQDGNDRRPEAASLARAVAEIRALNPAPHLVLFAGDLAHDGNPSALALGEEILSDLTLPVLAVRGEGDGRPAPGGAGRRFFADSRFFYTYNGINLLGLDTIWQDSAHGPGFTLGASQRRWLAGVLTRLDPALPLIVLSHAPLTPMYRPWGQWTLDSGPLLDHLSRFENVLYIHGHVHHSGDICFQGRATPGKPPPPLVGGGWGEGEISSGAPGRARFTPSPTFPHPGGGTKSTGWGSLQHISLPSTSWPLPSPLTGTPRKLVPGLGPRGCGWAHFHQGSPHPRFHRVIWQA